MSKCPHGKYNKYRCRDCGGSEICEHGRRKETCRDCGGSQVCLHGKPRHFCRECKALGVGGSGLCEHGYQRFGCKYCGKERCKHKRRQRECTICAPDGAFKAYVRGASKRGINFTLTLEEFKEIIVQPCLYCGEHNQPRGIDRWDNEIGYVFSNCRSCCATCNQMKQAMDVTTFVNHIQRMADHTRVVELSDLQAAFCAAKG